MRALIGVLMVLTFTGCFQASGSSVIRVDGEATVRHTIDVDVCDGMEPEAKQACIETVLEILAEASKQRQQ